MSEPTVRLDVRLDGGVLAIECQGPVDVAVSPELDDAARWSPQSSVLRIEVARLLSDPTACSGRFRATMERARIARLEARAVRKRTHGVLA